MNKGGNYVNIWVGTIHIRLTGIIQVRAKENSKISCNYTNMLLDDA